MNSTSAPAPPAGGWEDLVTTALLGTDRRTPRVTPRARTHP